MLARIILIVYLILVNFLGIASMASDKIRAMEHRYRIPEAILILFAIIGGSIGMFAGMLTFRHKTQHWYFKLGIPAIIVAQFALLLLLSRLLG